jgi:phosphoglycolate phosphatase-like HAD superfamily hydrolase
VLARRYTLAVDAAVAAAPAVSGAVELLSALEGVGCARVLSSATPASSLDGILTVRGWRPFFEEVHGAPARKADTLKALLHRRGWLPESIVVIGDGDDDVASAAEVGCASIRVHTDPTREVGSMALSEAGERVLALLRTTRPHTRGAA